MPRSRKRARHELSTKPLADLGYSSPLLANGTRLLVFSNSSFSNSSPSIAVLDASDLDELTYEKKGELSSYSHRLTVSGDLALWYHGLEVVDLGD
ncbi:hypothetical protein WMF37_38785 [Sorangium sp. So ce291]|uniref:hypothetical protein n=1 Tax=Sorangium sp. So ce291 TaxID=3133294 RepID=UPI003F620831